ncbi:hypothetical protein HPB49_001129 [Dermacentor silvarum]|uniref:Uncharacterized protein n=1 Tax=Dermacentor silvarum TaxID=543639 RepID=A0ACB8DSY9_DERSI|nr:hypothetical protein HPB49_001129 [Dermacentor silvarum]
MLYGQLAEKDIVVITDLHPDGFYSLLKYFVAVFIRRRHRRDLTMYFRMLHGLDPANRIARTDGHTGTFQLIQKCNWSHRDKIVPPVLAYQIASKPNVDTLIDDLTLTAYSRYVLCTADSRFVLITDPHRIMSRFAFAYTDNATRNVVVGLYRDYDDRGVGFTNLYPIKPVVEYLHTTAPVDPTWNRNFNAEVRIVPVDRKTQPVNPHSNHKNVLRIFAWEKNAFILDVNGNVHDNCLSLGNRRAPTEDYGNQAKTQESAAATSLATEKATLRIILRMCHRYFHLCTDVRLRLTQQVERRDLADGPSGQTMLHRQTCSCGVVFKLRQFLGAKELATNPASPGANEREVV